MATKGNKKTNYEANEAFLQYEEEIVTQRRMVKCLSCPSITQT